MKRLLLTGLLICGLTALVTGGEGMRSGQVVVTVTDSITPLDTSADSVGNSDTVYSPSIDVSEITRIQFYCQLTSDSDFVYDTCTVRVQFSPWLTIPDWQYLDDTLFTFILSNDTSFGAIYSLDTLAKLPDLMRFECVRDDSAEVTQQLLITNTYDASFVIRFKGWK